MNGKTIAEAEEVLEYLTAVMRGTSSSTHAFVVGDGIGTSHIESFDKPPEEKERLKAAELIGKRYGLFTEKQEIKVELPVVIDDSDLLE